MPSKLPRPGKPKTLRKLSGKHKRSPIKGAAASHGNSHIAGTDYDPETGHLTVDFGGGRRYRYAGVSAETASGMDGAESLGRYLHEKIIGKHTHEKL